MATVDELNKLTKGRVSKAKLKVIAKSMEEKQRMIAVEFFDKWVDCTIKKLKKREK